MSAGMTTVSDRKRKLCFDVSGNVQLRLHGSVWVCPLMSDEHPQLEQLNWLHVIGRVKTELPVVQATFTPALLVLLLQLRQLVPFSKKD